MPWNSKKENLGFSSFKPWLPANNEYLSCSVNEQIEDKNSMLNYTKDLIKKRKGIAT